MRELTYRQENELEYLLHEELDWESTSFADLWDFAEAARGWSPDEEVVGEYIMLALEPMFGLPECSVCHGEGERLVRYPGGWHYPNDVLERCDHCHGEGVEPWALNW